VRMDAPLRAQAARRLESSDANALAYLYQQRRWRAARRTAAILAIESVGSPFGQTSSVAG